MDFIMFHSVYLIFDTDQDNIKESDDSDYIYDKPKPCNFDENRNCYNSLYDYSIDYDNDSTTLHLNYFIFVFCIIIKLNNI